MPEFRRSPPFAATLGRMSGLENEDIDSMEEDDFSSYHRDDDDLDEIQMGLIFSNAPEIKPETRLEFPEFFAQVPTHLNA